MVDDGMATGAAIRATLRAGVPAEEIGVVPVFSTKALEAVRGEADHVFRLLTPRASGAVGAFLAYFDHVYDAEVTQPLATARA